ncbi:Thermonuclease precursor [Planctomycetes bacterium Pla163]|uniref:Thermonuclease n=1 Tax=Rohdeia mirabilis TaxID=2528008 RepID=A0A518CYZ6_9BACT|nr:Thermonuclease precursor [Planctomycetes bacterium Pla163]
MRTLRPVLSILFVGLLGALGQRALAGATDIHGAAAPSLQERSARAEADTTSEPLELFEVVRIVDGDTLHITRNGVKEKLRLLSVDTEEKLSGNPNLSETKPETLFGQEATEWAQRFFPARSSVDGKVMVGLRFPDGVEAHDVYGRLLCHVLLADGTDFNVLLVREGWSPYFNKYGNSRICHAEFVAAQNEARRAKVGIWNPETNRPDDPSQRAIVRPYDRLLPWWNARAEAIDGARARHERNPVLNVEADRPDDVQLAAWASEGGATVEVFGSIDRIFDEDDGSVTLLLRTGEKDRAIRVRIAKNHNAQFDLDDLRRRSTEEFIQNYLVFRGTLQPARRGGWELWVAASDQVRLGGPEPR